MPQPVSGGVHLPEQKKKGSWNATKLKSGYPQVVEKMVDLTGIEPVTSSMPFLASMRHGKSASDTEGPCNWVTGAPSPLFTCSGMTLRDTARLRQGWEGYDTSHDTKDGRPKTAPP